MTETRLITVGEDSKICVWNLEHGTLGIHCSPCILEKMNFKEEISTKD